MKLTNAKILEIIRQIIDKGGKFYRKYFIKKMEKQKYKIPSCYLGRYTKKGFIKRISKGYYKLTILT